MRFEATLPTAAGTARGLRDSPFGKVAILVAILVAALLVSKSCGKTDPRLEQDEAIAIAKRQIDYAPDCVRIRLVKRGFQSRETWAVSLPKKSSPQTSVVTVVQVDGDTGRIVQVARGVQGLVKC